MRPLFFFFVFFLSCAHAFPKAPRLSGAQLLFQFQQDPRYAKGYLAGVADAAQGRPWCDTGRVKSVELDGIVIDGIKALPEPARQGDAARLAVAILASPSLLGDPEKFGRDAAIGGICQRKGIVAFFRIPGYLGGAGGHIDILLPSTRVKVCGSECYWTCGEVWFRELR